MYSRFNITAFVIHSNWLWTIKILFTYLLISKSIKVIQRSFVPTIFVTNIVPFQIFNLQKVCQGQEIQFSQSNIKICKSCSMDFWASTNRIKNMNSSNFELEKKVVQCHRVQFSQWDHSVAMSKSVHVVFCTF